MHGCGSIRADVWLHSVSRPDFGKFAAGSSAEIAPSAQAEKALATWASPLASSAQSVDAGASTYALHLIGTIDLGEEGVQWLFPCDQVAARPK
jgi:hypothetical protein